MSRRRQPSPTFFILTAAVLAALPVADTLADDRLLSMRVIKAHDASASNSSFDGMARDAQTVARTSSDPADVACPLVIARSGDIVEHETLPFEITTQAQLDKIAALDADVFIMDELSICGTYVNVPAVAGCERPGPILVEAGSDFGTVRSESYLTLIHEVGHEAGLGHATSKAICDNPDQATAAQFNNIMFCKRHPARVWMSQHDCTTIRNTADFRADQPDVDLGAPSQPDPTIETGELPAYSPIQAKLMSLFGDGIDFAGIAALSAEELDAVRMELRSDNPQFWSRAAYVLGIRGDERDLEALVALAHRAANIDSPEAYRARTAVPQALGLYISNHPDDNLDWVQTFLLENVVTGNARTLGRREAEAQLLAEHYAQGLALGGNAEWGQAAVELMNQQGFEAELVDAVAGRALAASMAEPEAVLSGTAPMVTEPQMRLQEDVLTRPFNPDVLDTLRQNGLTPEVSPLLRDFSLRQFTTVPTDLTILDDRILELNRDALQLQIER